MKRELIVQLHANFEQLVHQEEESGIEFWLARDLQKALGYDRWENFDKVNDKAISACEQSDYEKQDHFLETTKMVPLGSGSEQVVEKAVTACQTAGYNPSDHFAEVSKMIHPGMDINDYAYLP